MLDELKRKDFIAVKNIDPATLLRADLVDYCSRQFRYCNGLMAYLCFALELDY